MKRDIIDTTLNVIFAILITFLFALLTAKLFGLPLKYTKAKKVSDENTYVVDKTVLKNINKLTKVLK